MTEMPPLIRLLADAPISRELRQQHAHPVLWRRRAVLARKRLMDEEQGERGGVRP